MAVSQPMGGGGPAKGLQLKNLKSHTTSLHREATLESLTSYSTLKTEVEVSSESLASVYHPRRPKTVESPL
jgi:hypothetical protein